MKFFKNILISAFFLSSCKNDLNLDMQYQKVLLAQKGNASIYCYNLIWSFDSQACFISYNNDICMGFDSVNDYCYGKGNQLIYYKYENDTLRLYSYGSRPSIPASSSINITLMNLRHSDLAEYENKAKEKQLEKVIFDSLYDIPCKLIAPPINLSYVRFKSDNISK
jgi:hypothetical protein